MRTATLGRTGLAVSQLGYGAWGIGGGSGSAPTTTSRCARCAARSSTASTSSTRRSSTATATASRSSGAVVREPPRRCTSPRRCLRRTTSGRRGRASRSRRLFPATGSSRCTERSLAEPRHRRRSTSSSSTSGTTSWVEQGDWLETVERLKPEGKIRFFGVSINDHQPANAIRLVETGVVDTVQVIYNVFDSSPEDELFAGGAGGGRRRDRARAVRRGLAHGQGHAGHGLPRGRLPQRLLRRRPPARGLGARPGDRPRPRASPSSGYRRSRCASASRTRPSRP